MFRFRFPKIDWIDVAAGGAALTPGLPIVTAYGAVYGPDGTELVPEDPARRAEHEARAARRSASRRPLGACRFRPNPRPAVGVSAAPVVASIRTA